MVNVLFVCLGNICRSPLAEGILKDKVVQKGLADYIKVDSAGTSGWHINEAPDRRSADIALRNGIKLDHVGRQLLSDDFSRFDYIIAMDSQNFNNIINLQDSNPDGNAEIYMIQEFDNKQSGHDVPDPYYGGPNGFQLVYDMMDESITNFLDHIVTNHNLS
jgi:protein-tyrosine phosphatase